MDPLEENPRRLTFVFRGLTAFGSNRLGRTGHNASALDEALDEPVTFAGANLASLNASFAEIVISTVADAAMKVSICHGFVTVVAEDLPEA